MATQSAKTTYRHTNGMRLSSYVLKLRNRHFFLLDIFVFLLTPLLAITLRLDRFPPPAQQINALIIYTSAALLVRLAVFYRLGLYRRYWAYASIDDLVQIVLAVIVSTTLIILLFFIARNIEIIALHFPRSIPLIDALLVLMLVGGIRFAVRFGRRHYRAAAPANSQRVLIFGAGDAGSMVVREMQSKPQIGLEPAAYLDDDPKKRNMRIHDLTVLGGRQDLLRVINEYKIECVIIAMPTAPGEVIREIRSTCDLLHVETKIVPGISEILNGNGVHVSQLREVDIQDLLRREPVRTDIDSVRRSLAEQRVLVTGGGGSIGSELCRQILYCMPEELIILGHGENSVFEIYHELRHLGVKGPKITPIIADIRFDQRLRTIFDRLRPQVVFHAAAHKHVPLMELNPTEAITNNILGTRNLLDAAIGSGVERYVMISTDKAVNPTSVMGASKRVAEMLVNRAAEQSGLPYAAVRFGNVLGSRGSVVFTFKKQIAAGGPVTVTDPAVKRYFMTVSEAVQLVLQASILGHGGEIFVLDMGEPISIDNLARDMIKLSGFEPGTDIPIEYIGLRPGDKLFEELFADGEVYHRTQHEKIFVAGESGGRIPDNLEISVETLHSFALRNDRDAIIKILCQLVPDYLPADRNLIKSADQVTSL